MNDLAIRIARATLTVLAAAVALMAAVPATAQETVILDGQRSLWRSQIGYKTPVVLQADGAVRPLWLQDYFWMPAEGAGEKVLPAFRSAHPAEGWSAVDFDDLLWSQSDCPIGPGYRGGREPDTMWTVGGAAQVNVVCVRGKFRVSDPAKAGRLRLAVQFGGGAIVRLNGREVARGHMPAGPVDLDTLAQPYGPEAYLDEAGKLIVGELNEKSAPQQRAQFARRVRRLEVDLPAGLLRAGVNVLAIEVHRAAFRDVYRGEAKDYHGKMYRSWPSPWPHCRLLDVTLTADGAGVEANVARPAGVQLWQPTPLATVSPMDRGDPCEPLRPIRLVAVRNGQASDQLVVSSPEPIARLTVTAGDLRRSDGKATIPAAAVRVRFARFEGDRFDALLAERPEVVAVADYRRSRNGPVEKVAMQPIWVTLAAPADASPGEYSGSVRVSADGLAPVDVPLSVKLHDWRLPDAGELTTHNNFWQSHESVALVYDTPLWSDRHFELMGRGLALTAPLGNRFCNVHLVRQAFQAGNSESMVRWIARPDGGYDYDFSVFDRYLDCYEKALGKPRVLLIDVCVSIHSRSRPTDGSNPVQVSRLDPNSGKVEPMDQPVYDPPAGVKFWKPVLDEVRKRLEKRGWWDVAVLGTASDSGPTGGEARTFKEIWPDKGWLFSGHPNVNTVAGGVAPVSCIEWVWGAGVIWRPESKQPRPQPWKADRLSLAFPRFGSGQCELYQNSPLSEYRLKSEKAVQCGRQGLGRVGIDFWWITDRRNRRYQLTPGGGQFTFNAGVASFLAAGPDGPVETTRSQMFREGLQVREAMTWLDKQADAGKLPPPLVERVQTLLTERAARMLAVDGHRDWQANDDALFALCVEAARAAAAAR